MKKVKKLMPWDEGFLTSFSFHKSMALEAGGNPEKAIYNRLNIKPRTAAQRKGHVVEAYASMNTDPSKNPSAVLVYDVNDRPDQSLNDKGNPVGMTAKRNKAWKSSLLAKVPEGELVEKEEHEGLKKFQEKIWNDPYLKPYLQGETQKTIIGDVFGLKMKGILDICGNSIVTDVKTCTSANELFNLQIKKLYWDVQAVIYMELAKVDEYAFLAIETAPPHSYMIHTMTKWDEDYANAKSILLKWIKDYKRCVKENAWDQGYGFYSGALGFPSNVNRYIKQYA